MTFTELNLDAAVQQAAQEQGCDMSTLEALKGVPLPMEMTITMNPDGASGTAVMTIDSSSLAGSAGSTSNEPQTFEFTYRGNTMTFTAPPSEGTTGTMTATVSWQGQSLVMSGVMTSAGQGVTMKATWQVTKQVGI